LIIYIIFLAIIYFNTFIEIWNDWKNYFNIYNNFCSIHDKFPNFIFNNLKIKETSSLNYNVISFSILAFTILYFLISNYNKAKNLRIETINRLKIYNMYNALKNNWEKNNLDKFLPEISTTVFSKIIIDSKSSNFNFPTIRQ
jgi:hypothetical protein